MSAASFLNQGGAAPAAAPRSPVAAAVRPKSQAQAFLAKDYSVSCNSDRYLAFRWYAIAMIMVYPVGESIRQQP